MFQRPPKFQDIIRFLRLDWMLPFLSSQALQSYIPGIFSRRWGGTLLYKFFQYINSRGWSYMCERSLSLSVFATFLLVSVYLVWEALWKWRRQYEMFYHKISEWTQRKFLFSLGLVSLMHIFTFLSLDKCFKKKVAKNDWLTFDLLFYWTFI